MAEFDGATALVTGGSRGIGRAIAARLARAGCTIDLVASRTETLDRAVAGLREETDGCIDGIAADLAEPDGVEAVVDRIAGRERPYRFLINNAGIARDGLLLRMRPEQWDAVLRVNLTAVYRITKAALGGMIRARQGRIVNMTSVVAMMGNPGQANYVASKAGVIGFTKSLAREVASRGITVNAVAPGFIATDMTGGLGAAARTALLGQIPLGRPGTPEDVAAAVAFLLGDGGSYITGEVLNVSGGLYM